MADRVFSEEELRQMERRTLDVLCEAIESGDSDGAKELASRMYRESQMMHDMYVKWAAGFMDIIYKNEGPDALYEALRRIIGVIAAPPEGITTPADLDPETQKQVYRLTVQYIVRALQGHLQPLQIREDDEKVCIVMQPCGSGQMLMDTGCYEPPCDLTMIQEPHPMTWGMTDFPIYCTHSPVLEILSIESMGYPIVVTYPAPKVAQGSCRYCIYKDPKDIPEEIYTRVGKEKPKQ